VNETAATGFTVLRTRLPYVDRRSLSEAWFSALHLASDADAAAPVAARGGGDAASHALSMRQTIPPITGTNGAAGSVSPATAGRPSSAGGATPVGANANDAARPAAPVGTASHRVASRGFAAARVRAYAERRTLLTVGVDGSRVQLLLRRDGPVLHVVALCNPGAAPAVSRALARADAALRVRGNAANATVTVV
jgi:hypothetical protein